MAKIVKVVKSSKIVDINYAPLLAFFFEGGRLQPNTIPYEQVYISSLAEGKGERRRTSS